MIIHRTNMKGHNEFTVVKDISSKKNWTDCTYTIKCTELRTGIECQVVFSLEELEQLNEDLGTFLEDIHKIDALIENQQETS